MTVEVTLNLPESLVEMAQRLGDATQRDMNIVLIDTLAMLLPTLEQLPNHNLTVPVVNLTDRDLLNLANSKLHDSQSQRIGELQMKGKTIGLSSSENYELLALLQIYQIGQLRKSEALAEAVKRGLCSPLHP